MMPLYPSLPFLPLLVQIIPLRLSPPLPLNAKFITVIITIHLLWHSRRHTPPKLTPRSSSAFPRIRIHQPKIIHDPGSSLTKYCRFSVTLTCLIVPPVVFRFICIGAPCAEEYVGQSIFPPRPWGTVAFLAFPLASTIDITGVLLMMKFPIIFEKVWMKPFVGVVALREK